MRREAGKFIKRLGAISLAGILGVSVLAGCGAKADTNGGSDSADGVKKVVVGTTGLYALQSFINDDGELDGAEIAVCKAIDEKLPQYEFEYSTMEFAAILPAVDAGKVQIACSNLSREANYIHSKEAYITSPYYIIVLDGNSDINGIDDLNGKKLGINEGSTQAGILEQYIAKSGADIELVYSSDPVPDLVAGRIDAIVDPQRYVLSLNSSYEDAQFKTVGEPIDNLAEEGSVVADYNAYLWFSPEDTELRDAVDTALAELYADGTLGEISKEYYGEDYAKDINRDYVESFK